MESDVKRIIVLGGLGLFGRTAAEHLRASGLSVLVASRRQAADITVDADNPDSLRRVLRQGDVVLDTAGPFQMRSTALIEAAIEIGFDVVDINDSLAYANKIVGLEEGIDHAHIRVLSSASSVSAVAAAAVRLSRVEAPVRVSGLIAPASRHTANPGSARSLIRSVGHPVRAFRNGQFQTLLGWSESKPFWMPNPIGAVHGRLFESADSLYLPRIWPSLTDVDMFVDTNTFGINFLLSLAARAPWLRRVLEHQVHFGTWFAKLIGSRAGGLGYEIESENGSVVTIAIVSGECGFVTAVAPAILAVRQIVNGEFKSTGVVRPDQHVDVTALCQFLAHRGVEVVRRD